MSGPSGQVNLYDKSLDIANYAYRLEEDIYNQTLKKVDELALRDLNNERTPKRLSKEAADDFKKQLKEKFPDEILSPLIESAAGRISDYYRNELRKALEAAIAERKNLTGSTEEV